MHARNQAVIADEVVPSSAYELQALAVHASTQALITDEMAPSSAYDLRRWRYMPVPRL